MTAGGRHQGVVIGDAVLDYVLDDGHQSQRTFFIELDRATMPVARLAQKLRSYVQYHDYIPGRPNEPTPDELAGQLGFSLRLRQRRFALLPLRGEGMPFTDSQGRGPGDSTVPEELADLISSIATVGVLQPIGVEEIDTGSASWLPRSTIRSPGSPRWSEYAVRTRSPRRRGHRC
ncbi:replication-relaxation family protein [Amycolatopsis sp. WAC 04169]|uniref:replication-relaxation family protein n=1 Tax=Amycolatopsis sp. WAC 04169 TaxID=2203197 RepID=UPI001F23A584|nr:replication-relaxation family protein [Amycolatopsis sp. WAC 04169]